MPVFLLCSLLISHSANANEASVKSYNPAKSGGNTTTKTTGANAFSQPAANLPMLSRLDFSVGNSFFRNPWIIAPSTTDARDGLGPLFNTNGCQNCHIKDGRGHPPRAGEINSVSMLVRLSVPAMTPEEKMQLLRHGHLPEPNYGGQIQDFSIPGAEPEAKVKVTYSKVIETFADGTQVELRKPVIELKDLAYGNLHSDTRISARVAPPMIGLGLLESIDAETLLEIADEQKKAGNGVSGRPNQVWDVEKQQTAVGRFGWKASQPTLMQQNAAAFNGDLGLTSRIFPSENCTSAQESCQTLPDGGEPEVTDKVMKFVEFYSQHLAVPARRYFDRPEVQRGEGLFADAGCGSCHRPTIVTGVRSDRPALSKQTIHPYTDLLLHDMGDGLADEHGEFIADGREWRTPPLWGMGYTEEVNNHSFYLHDGRARDEMEAILWHGGEAEFSKKKVLKMSKQQREDLVAFLKSL
ncbi:thiol oxidoreductase [Veronia pacifica]|uniref:Thiol oxidoreductase n=1 Tax=Veronia pacifica TaxID=1080227 RepID=A0A1C3EE04_9GAMM|nr:di-heme oxidoredictase family protein [Veronia pacifica]ODA31487.1 thiol oxidoreductase [Veronia pacifica]